ncbi:glycosyltransferase family 2 protein [Candidatus Poriferisocius sp.]|uniref:glycosyltransferase family 2 protein n=1 Tax=Candidatus Poriferisocius sp. TaxID=3101276 RepID=UPI003B012776
MPRLIAVIPAYNEAETIQDVVADLGTAYGDEIAVVVVDDGSSDDTGSLAATAGAVVLRQPVNLGAGAALRLGFRYATQREWDTALVIAADGQHIAAEVPALLAARADGADLVVGSRFHPDSTASYPVSRLRRAAMRLASRILRHRHGISLTDPTSGFWALSRPCVEMFSRQLPSRFLDDTLIGLSLAVRAGLEITEVPSAMVVRQGGRPSTRGLTLVYHYARTLLALSIGGRS